MATLHSRYTTRPQHSDRSHTNPPSTISGSWYTPSRSTTYHGDKNDKPWYHMAHTYTWVVENEYVTMDRGNKKTEQWILQQQMFLEAENAKHHAAARESTAQQEIWKETVYSYETKTERWMKHKEEARRRAGEKERKTRLIDEEIRRIETRMRIRREEERQKIAEERRKMQKERDRRNRLKAEKAVLEAWRGYEERWSKLITSSEALKFSSIPWPVVSVPGKAEDMTPQGVVAFLFSYLHSEKQTRKERLRSAQLRWHPDRFQRVLARVKDEDKAEVEQAVGIVARCLNDIKL